MTCRPRPGHADFVRHAIQARGHQAAELVQRTIHDHIVVTVDALGVAALARRHESAVIDRRDAQGHRPRVVAVSVGGAGAVRSLDLQTAVSAGGADLEQVAVARALACGVAPIDGMDVVAKVHRHARRPNGWSHSASRAQHISRRSRDLFGA